MLRKPSSNPPIPLIRPLLPAENVIARGLRFSESKGAVEELRAEARNMRSKHCDRKCKVVRGPFCRSPFAIRTIIELCVPEILPIQCDVIRL